MEKLRNITEWLNENYNQDSEKYNIIIGAKPEVIRYDDETAVSFWACGAIVCINSIMYFISEDDGHWYLENRGVQDCFSIGWVDSFTNAMLQLKKYIDENGKPVYFSGTDVICNYTL